MHNETDRPHAIHLLSCRKLADRLVYPAGNTAACKLQVRGVFSRDLRSRFRRVVYLAGGSDRGVDRHRRRRGRVRTRLQRLEDHDLLGSRICYPGTKPKEKPRGLTTAKQTSRLSSTVRSGL